MDRKWIIKTYYENDNSATATYRALRADYGVHNRPTTQGIGKIVKKFEETGAFTDIVRRVHHRLARSAENFAAVSQCCRRPECVDSWSFPGIRIVLRHIMAYLEFRSTSTFI